MIHSFYYTVTILSRSFIKKMPLTNDPNDPMRLMFDKLGVSDDQIKEVVNKLNASSSTHLLKNESIEFEDLRETQEDLYALFPCIIVRLNMDDYKGTTYINWSYAHKLSNSQDDLIDFLQYFKDELKQKHRGEVPERPKGTDCKSVD